jgi:transcriptional regulator with XRE-family HTH domain
MSRKKLIIDKNVCKNIKNLRDKTGLNGTVFANNIGITQGYLSDIENYKQAPSKTLLLAISFIYNTSTEWLKTGEGEMVRKFGVDEVAGGVAPYNKVEKPLDDDPMVAELLEAARKVLKSGNRVAVEALDRNIRYFAHTIEVEDQMSTMKMEISDIKEKIKRCPTKSGESILKKKM